MNNLINNAKQVFFKIKTMKRYNPSISSLLFTKIAMLIFFIPIVLTIALWLIMLLCIIQDVWYFKMIDYNIKIIDHIWTAPVITGILTFSETLVDVNNDNIPDKFQNLKEGEKNRN